MDTLRLSDSEAPFEVDAPEAVEGSGLSAAERARFEALYRNTYRDVINLLRRRLDNDQDVAEISQEAYLRVLRYRQLGADSLKYLLIRTAINLATSHRLAACRRLPHVALEIDDIPVDAPSLEEALDDHQLLQKTLAAIDRLPTRCREVFLLRLQHGLRQREIAERCGISTRMVESHLARAQILIRERVQELAA